VGPWRQLFCGWLLPVAEHLDEEKTREGGQIKPLGWSFVVLAMIINQFFHITSTELNSFYESFKSM